MSTFTILFLGDAGVGKTTFINRHKTGEFEKRYLATIGVDVHRLPFSTNKGMITFNVNDLSGQENFAGYIYKGYSTKIDAVVIMFDVTFKISYKNVSKYYDYAVENCKNVPIVLCGNKVDCKDRKVEPSDINFHRLHGIPYYDISAKSNYNFEKPFLYLVRKFLGEDTHFVESPALAPPEVSIDLETVKSWAQNLEKGVSEEKKESDDELADELDDTTGRKLLLFTKLSNSDVSLGLALQIINNKNLWHQWYQKCDSLKNGEIIISYTTNLNDVQFCIAKK